MARNWREIRADAIPQGWVDPARADAARKEMQDAVRAQRLADFRKAHGHARQADRSADERIAGSGVEAGEREPLAQRAGDAAVLHGLSSHPSISGQSRPDARTPLERTKIGDRIVKGVRTSPLGPGAPTYERPRSR